ncbi:AMP-binding protein [Pseudonocardia sp. Cha107L01]|uniref:AMP-binding protein n=1 Tax=Pseudonocardia sp. Cha107L01 TaxID=3457576 RepID=UPI00403EAE7E
MIIRSPYPDVVVPPASLAGFLFDSLDPADARRPAVIDAATGQGYTFGQLTDAVHRVAGALAARGLGRGDVAGLFAPNSPDYPVVFHGVLAAGATVSPVNALYTPAELAHQLRDAGATILFTGPEGLARARVAVAEAGVSVREIVVLGAAPQDAAATVPETGFEEFVATATPVPDLTILPEDLAALPYSSGTTGLTKGVMLTHRNLVANLLQLAPLGRIDGGSRLLAVLPLFHIYGLTGIMNQGLHRRALVVTMPRFELTGFLAAIAEHRIDHLYIAPPIALALAKSPLVDDYDLSSLRVIVSAAAPLDADLGRAVADRLGATVLQGYGLTESSPGTHGIPVDRPDIDLGTIGVLMPSVQARVVDPGTGLDVAPGEHGELWCRGPNVMRGYLNNPAATAATVDEDGFLHTGDLVTVDPGGVFRVVDRLKELIKYKGHQVAPAELEALLLSHEAVADAAVIGVPDPDCGEVPKAFVVRRDSHPGLDADSVLTFVAGRVAPHKKVRLVEFVDRIPKSAAGKILRKELRARQPAATS